MGNLLSSMRAKFENLRTLAFGSISAASYAAVGVPFANPIRILKISNTTDIDVFISFDGELANSMDVVVPNGFVLYDLSTNKADQAGALEIPSGSTVYVKRIGLVVPTSGNIYVTAIYASQT
jgi:hypothetical protein